MYILDGKVRTAKRHSSSHGNKSLSGPTHVTIRRWDSYIFRDDYKVTWQAS